ncbi:reverse transcriptase domain-containing protein [Methylophaga marina]|uniref:reverse transcriptase domain-containing protein n=1 Tax=Methylophaga marina TaxID=45495 RepID=UPI00257358B1|nr:reverse transcriptase domain-containing protein [Methylophaga marina]
MTKEAFLKLRTAEDVASLFGMSYKSLARILYRHHDFQYTTFELNKKNGGKRIIKSPSKNLKSIQRKLKDILYEIYIPKPSVHGFIHNRSIVTNAQAHLDRKFIFNIDLEDFYGSIHFVRIRNLFQADPFNFNHSVATILAQICVCQSKLPQGAPTSPIISNMIARKMDAKLQVLAAEHNCRYTRYADDITFSFTCKLSRLPSSIVTETSDGKHTVGRKLLEIIEDSGFKLNSSKTRLSHPGVRMEVTGLTVNNTPNVKRSYVKQIASMLYAWEKFGYESAEQKYNEKFRTKQRPSLSPVSFMHVVRGKLLFLSQVRGVMNPIYTKLTKRFNKLVEPELKLAFFETTAPEENANKSLWVIEAFSRDGMIEAQGTGFNLDGIGIVTSAHVIGDLDSKQHYSKLVIFRQGSPFTKYTLTPLKTCWHRDLAICQIEDVPVTELESSVKLAAHPPN